MPGYREPALSNYLHNRGRALGLPTSGTFELTPRCNFNCKMCYVHLTQAEVDQRGKELTAAQWLDIACQAKDAGMVFLLLTGGEPLLRPDFPELYTELKKMGFMISINSNGYLISGKLFDLLANDPPARINISLYGTSAETYRRMCGIPAFEQVVANIQALRQAGVQVKINMSLTPDNMEDMEAVYRAAQDLGVHTQATPYMFPPIRHSLDMIGKNNRMNPEQAGDFMAAYNALCMEPDEFCRYCSAMEQGHFEDGDPGDACEGTPGKGVSCRAGSSSFWLTWDGKMMPCGQMVEPAFDVLKLGFREAWDRTRHATEQIRLPSACSSCALQSLCHACAAMCYCETGRFDGKPEYLCQMYQSYVHASLRRWKEDFSGRIPEKENQL